MKKIILIILILILTGCDVKYSVELNSSTIVESLTIKSLTNDEYKKFDDFWIPVDYEIDDIGYFKSRIEDIDYYKMTKFNKRIDFTYNFDYDDFGNSTFLNNCYDDVTFTSDSYEIIFNTSDEFLCFDSYNNLNNVEVVIKSDYKLLDTNADSVHNGVYRWNINNNNVNNNIYLRLDNSYESNYKKKSFIQKIFNNNFFIYLFMFIFIFIVCFLLKKKGDAKNKI